MYFPTAGTLYLLTGTRGSLNNESTDDHNVSNLSEFLKKEIKGPRERESGLDACLACSSLKFIPWYSTWSLSSEPGVALKHH